jgi:competence protein ComEC
MDVANAMQAANRRTLIIYNVPAYTGIDVILGGKLQFTGDTVLLQNNSLRNRYLQPARLLYGMAEKAPCTPARRGAFISLGRTRMVIVDSSWRPFVPAKKLRVDYVLLSHHPRLSISQLKNMFTCKMIIFDASNPLWQIQRWKSDCSALTLRCFSVPEQGAYLINF